MKIAVIGTGLMGSAIADALLTAGHQLVAYDRDSDRCAKFSGKGGSPAASVAEAVQQSELAILVLPDAQCVEDALFSDEPTRKALNGKRILNASTTNAVEIVAIAKRVGELGGSLAEMTIMVGPDQVRAKESFFLLGCRTSEADDWTRIILSFGQSLHRVGEVGDASRAEAPIVFASALGIVTAAYAAAVALKLNLPKELTDGYAAFLPPGMDSLLPKMLTRSHENTFASVKSLVGVARAAEGTARALELPSAIFSDIAVLFDRAVAMGLANQDGSSLVEVLLGSSPKAVN